jgi:hypothetical protein
MTDPLDREFNPMIFKSRNGTRKSDRYRQPPFPASGAAAFYSRLVIRSLISQMMR